jgi:hypothetical protein
MKTKLGKYLNTGAMPQSLHHSVDQSTFSLQNICTFNFLLYNSIQFWSEFFTCEANVLALLQILGRFPGVNFQVVYTPISPNGRCKEEKICQTNFSPRGKEKENLIYVFPEAKLRGLIPNSYIL